MKILFFLDNDIYCSNICNFLHEELLKFDFRIIFLEKNYKSLPDHIKAMEEKLKFDANFNNFYNKIYTYKDVNHEDALNDFRAFAPDLIVSIRFKQIFQQPLINIPKLGVINLHSGILPKYRGLMPSFWAVLNQDKELGVTLHYIVDKTIDSGPIIDIVKQKVDYSSSLYQNIMDLYYFSCEMLLKHITKLYLKEKVTTIDQKTLGECSYFSYPTKNDITNFNKIMRLF